MQVNILSINESKKWHEYINKLPENQQDVYFTPEYYQLYEKYGDGKAKCFVFELNNEIALYPFLINSVDNKIYELDKEYFDIQGAYGYNGVISSCYDDDFINEFYKSFSDFCNENNIIAEFTRFHPLLENYKFSENYLTVFKDRQTVKLDLSKQYEDIWKNDYSKSNRNKIRKAEKSNIEVSVSDLDKDYKAFYEIYSNTMKGVGASSYYFFDYEYFKNFKSFLGDNQRLMVAKYEGKIVSALVMMLKGEYAHIHLSGSIYEYLKLGVNNKIKHEATLIARNLGAKYFHFGGGNSSDLEDHLFKFKANFSKERGDFYIGKKVHNEDIYNKICDIWEKNNPKKKEKYAKFLLKYREID